MNYVLYLLSGAASGVVAGMGMGGGTILIPVLTLLLAVDQHAAQGINMLAFIPAAVVSLMIHRKEGRLNVKECLPLILFGVAGALVGAFLSLMIDTSLLRRLFGGFIIVLGAVQLFMSFTRHKDKKRP